MSRAVRLFHTVRQSQLSRTLYRVAGYAGGRRDSTRIRNYRIELWNKYSMQVICSHAKMHLLWACWHVNNNMWLISLFLFRKLYPIIKHKHFSFLEWYIFLLEIYINYNLYEMWFVYNSRNSATAIMFVYTYIISCVSINCHWTSDFMQIYYISNDLLGINNII